jgi:amidophosphoribosyltransferase
MCGIVGIYLKNKDLHSKLGTLFCPMLKEMGDRGPDSSGFAIYRENYNNNFKVTLYSPDKGYQWKAIKNLLKKDQNISIDIKKISTHAYFEITMDPKMFRTWLTLNFPEISIMSIGTSLEIYKEVGMPSDVIDQFGVSSMSGSHMIGHTRMATESAVTTQGAHPFNTGEDLCLVHNGSLSNHNDLKRWLSKEKGIIFQTENDTEVAAGYLSYKMEEGLSLKEALEESLNDLDGFFTFTVGTKSGFAVLRDPIACKPAVIAETEDWVAMSSEYRALARLPDVSNANVWEPKPGQVYSWGE